MRYGRRTSRPHSLHTYLQILPFDFPGDPDSDGLGEVRTKAAPSSIDWAGLSFMAFPDVVPDRIRAQLLPGGRSASSLVPPKTEYPDTQSVYPWPATEGDVVDCVVSNCLDAMKKYYPDGSQVDHMYVVHPAKPRYVRQGNYVDTTEFTGEPRQFVVLIVEEKVLGYVSKFANKVEWKKEVLVTDLSSLPPNGLQRATYAQLLKYSSTFKCTRLLLTDYATTYGMQLSAPAPAATSMLPGDADGIDEASDELSSDSPTFSAIIGFLATFAATSSSCV